MSTPPCASCGRQVRLKAASPAGPICSACHAHRNTGTCGSCGRAAILVGRNPDGNPWCSRCYAASAAAHLADERREIVLTAVTLAEPDLATEAVQVAIHAAGTRGLPRLSAHLGAHPAALREGPNSHPPALGRFVQALAAAGSQRIGLIHPVCADCGHRRPVKQQVEGAVLCGACHARRSAVKVCVECGERRRVVQDQSGILMCQLCLSRKRAQVAQAAAVAQTVAVLSNRTGLDEAVLETIVSSLGRRRGYLPALSEQLEAHDLVDSEMSFEVARLVIALRAAGADLPAPTCQSCGEPTGPGVSTTGSRIRCHACVRLCPQCDRSRRAEGERICEWCRRERTRNRGTCVDCARPDKARDAAGRCHACAPRTARRCADCGQANRAGFTRTGDSWICRVCALRRALDRVLPAESGGTFRPLRAAILHAEPSTTRRWIMRPEIASVLTELAASQTPLTHELLDAQPAHAGIDHLRDLLVAAGALPADQTRTISRFELDAQRMLADLLPTHARLVRSWLRWAVLPHFNCPDATRDLIQAMTNARRTLRQVIAFVGALEDAGTTVQGCDQCQLDEWFATSMALHHQVRPFLSWMQRTNHLSRDLTLPTAYRGKPERRTDSEERWRIARRLVTDDTLDPADRVAGALVALYAQPLGRVVALTIGHVGHAGEGVTLRLGSDLLDLADPFATLVQSLPRRRRRGVAEQLPTRWLFPGSRAGRHISAAALGNRLRALGIEPRRTRLAALDQLTKEVPPALLAGVLGIHTSSVVATTNRSGGNWARYAGRASQESADAR